MPSDLVPSPFFICFCTVLPLCNCSLQLINFQGEQKLKWLHLAWPQRWFFSNWLLLTRFYHFNHIKILSPFGLSWLIWIINACAFPFLTGTSLLMMLIATKIKTDYGWKGKTGWWLLFLPLQARLALFWFGYLELLFISPCITLPTRIPYKKQSAYSNRSYIKRLEIHYLGLFSVISLKQPDLESHRGKSRRSHNPSSLWDEFTPDILLLWPLCSSDSYCRG